jgi:ABC-2 type transport system permease protein
VSVSFGAAYLRSVAAIPLALFIASLHDYFVLLENWTIFGLFLFSTALTALLQFFMSYALAMLAFWVLEVSTFIFIVYAFDISQWAHVPFGYTSQVVESVLFFLPFPYQLYFR